MATHRVKTERDWVDGPSILRSPKINLVCDRLGQTKSQNSDSKDPWRLFHLSHPGIKFEKERE